MRQKSERAILDRIMIKKWHKHVAIVQFRHRLVQSRRSKLLSKSFEALDIHARLKLAAFAKISMIKAYFNKKQIRKIFKEWLPATRLLSQDSNQRLTKARFFNLLKRHCLGVRDQNKRHAHVHYCNRLMTKTLKKLVMHKEE